MPGLRLPEVPRRLGASKGQRRLESKGRGRMPVGRNCAGGSRRRGGYANLGGARLEFSHFFSVDRMPWKALAFQAILPADLRKVAPNCGSWRTTSVRLLTRAGWHTMSVRLLTRAVQCCRAACIGRGLRQLGGRSAHYAFDARTNPPRRESG